MRTSEPTRQDPQSMLVTEGERRLLIALRQIPPSTLRTRVLGVIDSLTSLATVPRCAESQADGVPCGDSGGHCDSCARVYSEVHAVVRTSFPLPSRTLPEERLRDTGVEHAVGVAAEESARFV